jgi:hypothetical protein
MVEDAKFCMIESVGGVDKNALAPHIHTSTYILIFRG